MSGSRFALLKELPNTSSSEERRDLLRRVTDALSDVAHPPSEAEFAALDGLLSKVANEYSVQVRAEFAHLVASSGARFAESAEQFALDDIEIAEPVLRHSEALPEPVLIKVASEKSQAHKLAVTKRSSVSEAVSHALVEHGNDDVLVSLLANERAQIAENTYDRVLRRAETSPVIHGPLVRRGGVPVDILHSLYQQVESQLRTEILAKFEDASPEDLEKAFKRSRERLTSSYAFAPDDMPAARKRLRALQMSGQLKPAVLPGLLREGPTSRTAFKLVFAHLADVETDVVDRAVETGDMDALALLCRGARFEKGLFTSMAVALDPSAQGLGATQEFGELYEAVPVEAAQRALRFWKVRNA
jgi:uncharacterized protein (DUF2336 family)